MNRSLAAAVLATFRDGEAREHHRRFEPFSAYDWQASLRWLDASGLALYFLDRVKSLGLLDAIPHTLTAQLEQRQADNRQRMASLFTDCMAINQAFREAGLRYVNLKGCTLVPEYCPDLSLRFQMDCDVLADRADAERCREILCGMGYQLLAADADVMEFKSDAGHIPHVRDLYKAKEQRSVEVHLCSGGCGLLERSGAIGVNGVVVPALSAEDMFIAQAAHVFHHVRSEWTRASWLLEFQRFVTGRRNDSAFWRAVESRAIQTPGAAMAVGVAVRFAERAFGECAPDELTEWNERRLPSAVKLWIERYARPILLSDFPGSKLYLILECELDGGQSVSRTIRRRLLPLRVPGRIVATPSTGIARRVLAKGFQFRYFWFRLRFHVTQGARYLLESRRWERLLRQSDSRDAGRQTASAVSAND